MNEQADKIIRAYTTTEPPEWCPLRIDWMPDAFFKRVDRVVLFHPTFSEEAVDGLAKMTALRQITIPYEYYTQYGLNAIRARHPTLDVQLSERREFFFID